MAKRKSSQGADMAPLAGLLGAVLGGHPDVQGHMDKTGQSMDQVLGALLGAQGAQPRASSDAGDPLASLLGALASGGTSSGANASAAGGDALAGLLGGLLGGGGMPSAQTRGGMGADPMSSMLGALLGGGGAQGGALGSNAFLAPIVNSLAEKIGIDPKIAQLVVSFVLVKLLTAQTQGASKDSSVKGLVDRMGSGKRIDQKYLNSTGLPSELASQSGLDSNTAAQSLVQVLNAFSKQMSK